MFKRPLEGNEKLHLKFKFWNVINANERKLFKFQKLERYLYFCFLDFLYPVTW